MQGHDRPAGGGSATSLCVGLIGRTSPGRPTRHNCRTRKERGLSPEALAERAELAADYLGFIERGENVPTLTVLLKLARAIGVDASVLLGEFTLTAIRRLRM